MKTGVLIRRRILLLAALISWVLPATIQAQFTFVTNNGAITIAGYTGTGGAVIIPSATNGWPVTTIGVWAFSSTNISSITIPDSITSISGWAFYYCSGLTGVTIGNGATYIASQAFYGCSNINTITVGCPDLGNWFSGLPITNVTILDTVTNIANYSFNWCTRLTSVTIPDSVISIGREAFAYCSGLTNVIIGNGVTNIAYQAFAYCSSLRSVTIIGNGGTSIGYQTFYGCSGLTSVSIGNGVTNIDYSVFIDCSGLTNISVAPNNPMYRSVDGIVFDASQATLIKFPGGLGGSYIIPSNVTNIGNHAFAGCSSVTNVTIPNSVTSIGINAFGGCYDLTSVTIPDSVTNIGSYAFEACFSLKSVFIGNGITSISDRSFADCFSLTSITIPNSVTNIGNIAFSDCSSLTSVTIGNGVTSIGINAFQNCRALTSVTIPDNVINIGYDSFAYCSGLTNFTVATNNPAYSSEGGVLFDASQSTLIQFPGSLGGNYTVPNSVTNIGDWAFRDCSGLNGIYFAENAPSVGLSAFSGALMTIYYLPNTTGWGPTFAGRPTALWLPAMQTSDASFGVQTNQFGFTIQWANGQTAVVEACTNVANPVWNTVATNTLTGGTAYFSDPDWTNYSISH